MLARMMQKKRKSPQVRRMKMKRKWTKLRSLQGKVPRMKSQVFSPFHAISSWACAGIGFSLLGLTSEQTAENVLFTILANSLRACVASISGPWHTILQAGLMTYSLKRCKYFEAHLLLQVWHVKSLVDY